MRYFKIPLCQKIIDVKRPKCPLRTKTTQTDSDRLRCNAEMIFRQKLINDSCRQIEKTQRQIVGTKMDSTVGNDQNALLYDFYAKIWNKMQENMQWF